MTIQNFRQSANYIFDTQLKNVNAVF